MHSNQLQCTVGNFIAQQEALLHSRKFCYITKKSILRQKLEKSYFWWQKQRISTTLKFLLRQKLEKSSFCGRNWRKVTSAAETENKHHVLLTVSMLLADKTQFAHKSDQIELQLDQSQLPYSKYSGPIPQEAAQPTLTTKRPTTLNWRLHWRIGIKIGRMRYFSLANMFPSPYQSKTCRCS